LVVSLLGLSQNDAMRWERLIAAGIFLGAISLWLVWMGEGWRRPGENHSILYVGIRHEWRLSRQSVRDTHRRLKGCGGSPACVSKELKFSLVHGERLLVPDSVPEESEDDPIGIFYDGTLN
jgi:hypothetical protein